MAFLKILFFACFSIWFWWIPLFEGFSIASCVTLFSNLAHRSVTVRNFLCSLLEKMNSRHFFSESYSKMSFLYQHSNWSHSFRSFSGQFIFHFFTWRTKIRFHVENNSKQPFWASTESIDLIGLTCLHKNNVNFWSHHLNTSQVINVSTPQATETTTQIYQRTQVYSLDFFITWCGSVKDYLN